HHGGSKARRKRAQGRHDGPGGRSQGRRDRPAAEGPRILLRDRQEGRPEGPRADPRGEEERGEVRTGDHPPRGWSLASRRASISRDAEERRGDRADGGYASWIEDRMHGDGRGRAGGAAQTVGSLLQGGRRGLAPLGQEGADPGTPPHGQG